VSSESATVKRPETALRGGQPDTIGRIRLVRPSSRVGQPSASTHQRMSEAPVEAMASSESAANDAAQCRRKESTVGGTPVRGEIEVAGNTGVISARTRRPTVAPNLATTKEQRLRLLAARHGARRRQATTARVPRPCRRVTIGGRPALASLARCEQHLPPAVGLDIGRSSRRWCWSFLQYPKIGDSTPVDGVSRCNASASHFRQRRTGGDS
jgi:hypothetical protein